MVCLHGKVLPRLRGGCQMFLHNTFDYLPKANSERSLKEFEKSSSTVEASGEDVEWIGGFGWRDCRVCGPKKKLIAYPSDGSPYL